MILEKINSLCKQKGISIAQLEREMGFANATIRRWDAVDPGVEKVEKVADYFGVTIDSLISTEPDAPAS